MSIDRAAREDDTPDPAASDNTDRNAERPPSQHAGLDNSHGVQRAETRTREEYASAMRTGGGPMSRDSIRDDQEAPDEEPRGQPERRDDAGASAQDQGEADRRPETMTFENKDIEVTHNAADGLWIEGLPGEPPARIGDIVTSPEESGRSRIENFRHELSKDAEDLVDMGGKWTDLIRDAIGTPPPTSSMTHSRGPELTATQPDHGINAGHDAEALLTVAIVGAAALHKLHERWQQTWHH